MDISLISTVNKEGLRFKTYKVVCQGFCLSNTANKTFFATSSKKTFFELGLKDDELVIVRRLPCRNPYTHFFFGKSVEVSRDCNLPRCHQIERPGERHFYEKGEIVETTNAIFAPQGENIERIYRDANGEIVFGTEVQHIAGVPHEVEEIDDFENVMLTNLHTGVKRTLPIVTELAVRIYHELGGRVYYHNFSLEGKKRLPCLIDQQTGQRLCSFGWTTSCVNGDGFSVFCYQDLHLSDEFTLVFVTPV